MQDQLALTSTELEKQRVLNEKLENDLLEMNKHKPNGVAGVNGNVEGVLSPSDSQVDMLAGLELGRKKSTVGISP